MIGTGNDDNRRGKLGPLAKGGRRSIFRRIGRVRWHFEVFRLHGEHGISV